MAYEVASGRVVTVHDTHTYIPSVHTCLPTHLGRTYICTLHTHITYISTDYKHNITNVKPPSTLTLVLLLFVS